MSGMTVEKRGVFEGKEYSVVLSNDKRRHIDLQGNALQWYIKQGCDPEWLTDIEDRDPEDALRDFFSKKKKPKVEI